MRFSMLIWVSASASPSKLLPTSALQPMSETRLGTNDCESEEWLREVLAAWPSDSPREKVAWTYSKVSFVSVVMLLGKSPVN